MMDPAEKNKVVGVGLSLGGPMLDVMGLEMTGPIAARELTGPVTGFQNPPQGG